MAKVEWGIKRICQKCHTKYYDMQKEPIVCPKCGTGFQLEFLKSRDDVRGGLKDDDLVVDEVLDVAEDDDFDAEDIEDAVDIKEHDSEEKSH